VKNTAKAGGPKTNKILSREYNNTNPIEANEERKGSKLQMAWKMTWNFATVRKFLSMEYRHVNLRCELSKLIHADLKNNHSFVRPNSGKFLSSLNIDVPIDFFNAYFYFPSIRVE
jgi:hypothetical protein